MRTRNAKLATSFSSDGGDAWTPGYPARHRKQPERYGCCRLKDGRHVLIYNNFKTLPEQEGPRTPLSLAISDDGTHWRHLLTLEDSPINQYSYPGIIEGKDWKTALHLHLAPPESGV